MSESPYHHGNLRAGLLEAAEGALSTVGVDGLSLRGLARDLGVSHAAPSRHFRDKQALLDALALDGFARLNTAMVAAAAPGPPLFDRFAALARTYVDFATRHDELLTLMYTTKHHPDASEALGAAGNLSLSYAESLVAEGQATGVLRAGDPLLLATVAFAHVHGVAVLAAGAMLDDRTPLDVVLATTVETLWAGLTAR